MARRTLYMHTIEGCPARFDGTQVVYGLECIRLSDMCGSYAEMRKERRRSQSWRRKALRDSGFIRYGHIRVVIDDAPSGSGGGR